MRARKKGDELLIYHTGGEKAIVGIARIGKFAYPEPAGTSDNQVVVDIEAVRRLTNPVTLSTIKSDPRFKQWDLVRIGRLSVVPTTPAQFDAVTALAK